MMASNLFLRGNIIKNLLVIVIAALLYPFLSMGLGQIQVEQSNNILLIISMLLVTVCFANFAFTYEKSKLETPLGKLLATSATGVFMLLTALLLESIVLIVKIVYAPFYLIILGFSILLYLGIVLYDFCDLMRAEQ